VSRSVKRAFFQYDYLPFHRRIAFQAKRSHENARQDLKEVGIATPRYDKPVTYDDLSIMAMNEAYFDWRKHDENDLKQWAIKRRENPKGGESIKKWLTN
jgi:hypothetical protein